MKRNHRLRADAQLEALYAQVPELDCKGLCHTSCGVIEASVRERERMQEAGVRLPYLDEFLEMDRAGLEISCPALTEDKRCGVYEVRPMICRLWGTTDSMPCPYGCEPVDGEGLIEEPGGFELLAKSMEAGGNPDGRGEVKAEVMRRVYEANPGVLDSMIERGKKADAQRAQRQLRNHRQLP